jgi:hypothetical protein
MPRSRIGVVRMLEAEMPSSRFARLTSIAGID